MLHFELPRDIADSHMTDMAETAATLAVDVFAMPVLDSRMYILDLSNNIDSSDKTAKSILIVDPNLLADEDAPKLRSLCESFIRDSDFEEKTPSDPHASDENKKISPIVHVLLTHSHYDHIAGLNTLRTLLPEGTIKVYAAALCDEKLRDPHKNLSAYSMALVMGKTPERQAYCERYFDFDYRCSADEIISAEDEPKNPIHTLSVGAYTLKTIYTPGHSDCSVCIELWLNSTLLAVFTGDSLVNGHDVITRFPTGNKKTYLQYTQPYLDSLPDDTIILPGHGDPDFLKNLRQFTTV